MGNIAVALRIIVAAFGGWLLASFLGIFVAALGENLNLALGGRGESWQFIGMGAGIFAGIGGALLCPLGAFGLLGRRVLWAFLGLGTSGLAVAVLYAVYRTDHPVMEVWLYVSAFVGSVGAGAIACLFAKPIARS